MAEKPVSKREKKKGRRLKHLKRKKGAGEGEGQQTQPELDTSRLRAYGVNTRKLKRLQYNKKREQAQRGKGE